MTPEAIDRAAAIIAGNRLNRTRLETLAQEVRPADLSDAYAVQERCNALLAAKGLGDPVGYKIGCTTPVMQEYMNIHEPAFGAVFGTTVHRGHAALAHADFVEPGVETEIAVSLATDLPAAGAPFTRDSVRDAVGAVMISIELVDARYRDYRTLDTPTMVADNFFNAAVVLGNPATNWHDLDLAEAEAAVTLNGDALGRGKGSLIMGHPLEALVWLANRLAEQDRHLKADEFVTLGSVIPTHWMAKGDHIDHHIPGLGSVSITLT